MSISEVLKATQQETIFEKQRGINALEIQQGFASVQIGGLGEPLPEQRLKVLEAIAKENVRIRFLKLTPDGLAFVVAESDIAKIQDALHGHRGKFVICSDRSMVLVFAVNMRDDEGLVAKIISIAIANQVHIDHLSDMHDRLLILTDTNQATLLTESIRREMMEERI